MADGPVVSPLPRRVRVAGALVAAVTLVVGSLVPGDATVPAGGPLSLVGADKWLHAVGYAVLTAAVADALGDAGDGDRPRPALSTAGIALAAAVSLGVAVEVGQTAVPGRAVDVADLFANAVGASTAATLWLVTARHVQGRR